MKLLWDDITEVELKRLYYDEEFSDDRIAELFGVTKGKVAYKRKKFGISIKNKIIQEFMNQKGEFFEELNLAAKERLLKRENIDFFAKAITHFAFRNGPVEDMHAKSQLSQNDMKILNKYMVNRIAGLLTTITDNNWIKIELASNFYRFFGTNWDISEPDAEEFNTIFQHEIDSIINRKD